MAILQQLITSCIISGTKFNLVLHVIQIQPAFRPHASSLIVVLSITPLLDFRISIYKVIYLALATVGDTASAFVRVLQGIFQPSAAQGPL